MQLCGTLNILWHCPSWDWNENCFQSYGHCWVFQIFWHTECSTLTTSSFRIWTSSNGKCPLALFIVMLPKAHLTSHSRMSGSRWMTTPLWLSGSLRPFLYSSVYFCHLFLIASASVRSLSFLSFTLPILAWDVPFISPVFLKRLLVFHILLFSSISLHCSLRKAFLSVLALLWNSALRWVYLSSSSLSFTCLLSSAICKASSHNHFAFLQFFYLVMVFIMASCTVLWISVHSSSGTLSDLIPWIPTQVEDGNFKLNTST